MNRMTRHIVVAVLAVGCLCSLSASAAKAPVFSLAWSEYPSWSAFGVASEYGLINGAKGKMGPIEKKWDVDIWLKEADYDTCIIMFGSGQCDAACLTDMDSLPPCLTRSAVAILPTSTSDGADACIVTPPIKTIDDLKGRKVYGLAKTVSEYCFVRNLELNGEAEKDFNFTNMDPGAAALAMQQKQPGFEAIVVWNPFVLETLNKRSDAKVLFDSTTIPGEIVDMVTMSQQSLERPGGDRFACAVIDTFYEINKMIEDPKTRDEALVALGEKFSHLDLDAMKKVVEQTRFYKTPDEGLAIFEGPQFKDTMKKVVDFCLTHEVIDRDPQIVFGSEGKADLRFDPQYIHKVKDARK